MTENEKWYDDRYSLDLISREAGEFQKALGKLSAEKKKSLLLTPLSEQRRENTLSYIVADRYADKQEWRIPFLTTALDEIEKISSPAERLAVLTGANELGQTLFHKALKQGVDGELFNILEERLRKWGGDDFASAFFSRLRSEPLGKLDDDVSKALHWIQDDITAPYNLYCSDNYQRLGSLSLNNYQPATYEGLKATVEKIRWILMKHTCDNPSDRPGPDYQRRNNLVRDFAKNANAIKKEANNLNFDRKVIPPKPPQEPKP